LLRPTDLPAQFICVPAAAQDFINAVASKDKEYVRYPDAWHDLLHEPSYREHIARGVEWLVQRCK
jgi:alpha-beta hydrolase superfamily lysophospholipase